MAEEYLTVIEAAATMRTSKSSVYALIYAGDLPRINVGTGKKRPRIRIRRSAVERFMASREKGTAA